MIRWDHFIVKLSLWLALEILLGWMGIDDLRDYSEFISQHRKDVLQVQVAPMSGSVRSRL